MEINAADELGHAPGEERLWRESLYFNFHDRTGRVGGMTTIGVLPNQGRVQGLAAVFSSASAVLFYHTEVPLGATEGGLCSVPGITYELVAALQRWRFGAAADFELIGPPGAAAGAAQPPASLAASFDLTFDALSPAHDFPASDIERISGPSRHFEQNGRVRGRVTIGALTLAVEGYGFRDHSWGVRDLSRADQVINIFAQFGPDLTVNAVLQSATEQRVASGYVTRHGVNRPVTEVQTVVYTDSLSGLPKVARAEIGTLDGQHLQLQADVTAVLPILLDHGGARLNWYECSTRFTHEGRMGYGILEVTELVRSATEA